MGNPIYDPAGGHLQAFVRNVKADGSAVDDLVQGNVASGAADAGNPVKIGGKYNSALPTFTNGQRGDLQINSAGKLQVHTGALTGAISDGVSNSTSAFGTGTDETGALQSLFNLNRIFVFNGSAWDRQRGDTNGLVSQPHAMSASRFQYAAASGGILNTTTAVTIIAAGGASVRNYVTSIDVMWEALTNATEVAIRDGAAGTVIWRTKIPAGAAGHMQRSFAAPLKGSANTLMEVVTLTASGAGAVYFNAQGFQGA